MHCTWTVTADRGLRPVWLQPDTKPTTDDVVLRNEVWDGPNRVCDSRPIGDDTQSPQPDRSGCVSKGSTDGSGDGLAMVWRWSGDGLAMVWLVVPWVRGLRRPLSRAHRGIAHWWGMLVKAENLASRV